MGDDDPPYREYPPVAFHYIDYVKGNLPVYTINDMQLIWQA